MPKTSQTKVSADDIAAKASRGEDVSAYFTNKFTVVRPVHRVNVDLTEAVIKTLLSQALEERPVRSRLAKTAGYSGHVAAADEVATKRRDRPA
jgi:ABC-type microcin C transport system duplicated ATPase subunit YejF